MDNKTENKNISKGNLKFEIRDEIRAEIEKSLTKDNIIDEQDKILLFKLYLKIREEFKNLDRSKL